MELVSISHSNHSVFEKTALLLTTLKDKGNGYISVVLRDLWNSKQSSVTVIVTAKQGKSIRKMFLTLMQQPQL